MVIMNKIIHYLILAATLCAVFLHAQVSAEGHAPLNLAKLAIEEHQNPNAGNENSFLQEKRRAVVSAAATAVETCGMAYKALDDGDLDAAKGLIETARQQLTQLKSSKPDIAAIPIDAQGKLIHLSTDVRRLKVLQNKIKQLVANNNYQAARPLIDMMSDEMRVRIMLLPITPFKAEIESVSELIRSGYISRAKAHLHDAMDRLLVKDEMVPIPILRAEELVAEASNLNTPTVPSHVPYAETRRMIADARAQLKIAEMMGYGERKDYAEMNATAQSMGNEKNTSRLVAEGRRFLAETTEFKHKLNYMLIDILGRGGPLSGKERSLEALNSVSF